MRIDWGNIFEEAIGATISAAFIALVVYIYNLFTDRIQASSWFVAGLIVFALIILVAVAWQGFSVNSRTLMYQRCAANVYQKNGRTHCESLRC